jgi:hypothetical protein
MRYLKFNSPSGAETAERIIFYAGAQAAADAGYVVDAEGIVGQRGGRPAPDAARTQRWDDITEVANLGWLVAHPEAHSAATPERLAAIFAHPDFPPHTVMDASEIEWPREGET